MTGQGQPAVDLLSNMDVLHPGILLQHAIEPRDYKGALVFRSAVESIRGTFIASSTTGREGFVANILDNLLRHDVIVNYRRDGQSGRCDFTIQIECSPDYFAGIEVKGGEGNSINISERPLWA